MSVAAREQRRTPRIGPYVAPCRVVDGNRRLSAYLTDLSPRGARVACETEPPAVGAAVIVEVRFGRRAASRLPARVKWAQASPRGGTAHAFGITFEDVAPPEQQVLESVVAEFRRRAAELVS